MIINGNAYDWDNITLSIDTYQVIGITNIKWNAQRDFQNSYGAGHTPVEVGFGNHNFEASMTISLVEVGKLIDKIPTSGTNSNDLLDKEAFNITIQYGTFDGKSHEVVLENCRFHDFGVDVSQNDMQMEVEINLNPANIQHNSWTL